MNMYAGNYGTDFVGFEDSKQFGEDAFLIDIFDMASKEYKYGVVGDATKPPGLLDKLFGKKKTPLIDEEGWTVTDKHEIQTSVRTYQSHVGLKLKMRKDFGEEMGETDLASIVGYVTDKLKQVAPAKKIPQTIRRYEDYIGGKIDSGGLPPNTPDPRPMWRQPKVRQAGMVGFGVVGLGLAYKYKKSQQLKQNPYGLVWFLAVPLVMSVGAGGWVAGRKAPCLVTDDPNYCKKVYPDQGLKFHDEENWLDPDKPAFAQNDEAVQANYQEFKKGFDNNVDVHKFGEAVMKTSVWLNPTSEKIATRQASVFLMLAARYVKAGGDNATAANLYEDAEDMFEKADSASELMTNEGGNIQRIGAPLRTAWDTIYMANPSKHSDLIGLLANVKSHTDKHGIKMETKWMEKWKEEVKDTEHGVCLAWPKIQAMKYILGAKKPSCFNDRDMAGMMMLKYGIWIAGGLVALSYVRGLIPGGDDD